MNLCYDLVVYNRFGAIRKTARIKRKVNRFFTSMKTCRLCGTTGPALTLAYLWWFYCKYTLSLDCNADVIKTKRLMITVSGEYINLEGLGHFGQFSVNHKLSVEKHRCSYSYIRDIIPLPLYRCQSLVFRTDPFSPKVDLMPGFRFFEAHCTRGENHSPNFTSPSAVTDGTPDGSALSIR